MRVNILYFSLLSDESGILVKWLDIQLCSNMQLVLAHLIHDIHRQYFTRHPEQLDGYIDLQQLILLGLV